MNRKLFMYLIQLFIDHTHIIFFFIKNVRVYNVYVITVMESVGYILHLFRRGLVSEHFFSQHNNVPKGRFTVM